jgi:predicted RecB family nuclease
VVELRPNLRNGRASPWVDARRKIATELGDLTTLPFVGPDKRMRAMASGLLRWSDPGCTAASCNVTGETRAPRLDAVIRANHSGADGPIVFPAKVSANEAVWRVPAQAEFFVDFETVNDINEDFSTFPEKGGEPLIFMIGCGCRIDGDWSFRQFTSRLLTHAEEARIISEWLDHVRGAAEERGSEFEDVRLYHWSRAEESFLSTAYNAAARRHGLPEWDALPWVDLLDEVIKAQPVTVRGAFGFGLKAIAKAMHAHKLIETSWEDGSTDGQGAMAAAWTCDVEAREKGISMPELQLMKEVEAYNEVDCRVMEEVLQFLRNHR